MRMSTKESCREAIPNRHWVRGLAFRFGTLEWQGWKDRQFATRVKNLSLMA
jgi:hypothetical protein